MRSFDSPGITVATEGGVDNPLCLACEGPWFATEVGTRCEHKPDCAEFQPAIVFNRLLQFVPIGVAPFVPVTETIANRAFDVEISQERFTVADVSRFYDAFAFDPKDETVVPPAYEQIYCYAGQLNDGRTFLGFCEDNAAARSIAVITQTHQMFNEYLRQRERDGAELGSGDRYVCCTGNPGVLRGRTFDAIVETGLAPNDITRIRAEARASLRSNRSAIAAHDGRPTRKPPGNVTSANGCLVVGLTALHLWEACPVGLRDLFIGLRTQCGRE